MRVRVALACGLLAAVCQAASVSVIDPPVTLKVVDAAVTDVLAAVTRQTGTLFQVNAPEPAPRVSLAVERLPLRQVLRKLREQTGLNVWPTGDGRVMVNLQPPNARPDQRPRLELPGYLLLVNSVTTENTIVRAFGPQPAPPARQALRLQLALDANTEVLRRGLLGLDPSYELVLDGQAVKANQPQVAVRPGAPAVLWPSPFGDLDQLDLHFALPTTAVKVIDTLSGSLVVAPDARERLFEFTDLAVANQKLTAGETDLTLVRWSKPEPGRVPMVMGPRRPVEAGWVAELELSQPATEAQAGRAGGGIVPMFELAAPAADVRVEVRADGGDARAEAERALAKAMRARDEALHREALVRRADAAALTTAFMPRATLPSVVVETANGRVALTPGGQLRTEHKGEEKRVVTRFQMVLGKDAGEPQRLLVGVVERGSRTQRVPFAFKNVTLPTAG